MQNSITALAQTCARWGAGFAVLAPLSIASPASPQNESLTPIWAGQFVSSNSIPSPVGVGDRVLVGTGGGEILYTDLDGSGQPSGGPRGGWYSAPVPAGYTHTVLDIQFLEGSTKVAFACGRGGRILQSMDSGETWNDFGNVVLDECGDPATLWTVLPLTSSAVAVGGLWSSKVVTPNSQSNIEFRGFPNPAFPNKYDGPPIPLSDLHVYAIKMPGGLASGRLGTIAAVWEPDPDVQTSQSGVMFSTDRLDPNSNGGSVYRMVMNDFGPPPAGVPQGTPPPTYGIMEEPWEVAFERGSQMIGYVVGGGAMPAEDGQSYMTTDGGETWDYLDEMKNTMYGVVAEPGSVVAVGYSGTYSVLESNGTWTETRIPSAGTLTTPGVDTVPMLTITSTSATSMYCAGTLGAMFGSISNPLNWMPIDPYPNNYMEPFRMRGIASPIGVPNMVFKVGQFQSNVGSMWASSDFGATWSTAGGTWSTASLLGIDFGNSMIGAAVGDPGAAMYTVNGGTTWMPAIVQFQNSVTLVDLDLSANGTGYAVGTMSGGVMYVTGNGGQNWDLLSSTGQAPEPTDRLREVTFPNQTEGFVVGYRMVDTGESHAMAWTVDTSTAGTAVWTEVSPPQLPSTSLSKRKLLAVDSFRDSNGNLTVYAVGNEGMLLQWNGTNFVGVPGVFDLDPTTAAITTQLLAVDYSAISISPTGNRVLVGAQYDDDLETANDKGLALTYDGQTWSTFRSNTCKNAIDICLTTDNDGYFAGRTHDEEAHGNGLRLPGCSFTNLDVAATSLENSNFAGSIVLRFSATGPQTDSGSDK